MTMTSISGVGRLRQERPEWTPWLAVVDEALRECSAAAWDAAVPDAGDASESLAPSIHHTTVVVDAARVRNLFRRLIEAASRSAAPAMTTLEAGLSRHIDPAELMAASIRQDHEAVLALARRHGVDADALQAIVSLLAVPLLQACRRRWAQSIPVSRMEGFCPICAAWPAFVEIRGIERSRYLRCGRCGSEWLAHLLHCAFCGNDNHQELASLVPERTAPGAVDACRRCRGYVKTFTTLRGCDAASVMLHDLGSVELDVAALAQGYSRPSGLGFALDVAVRSTFAPPKRFAWNA
jgi:FdhE protein